MQKIISKQRIAGRVLSRAGALAAAATVLMGTMVGCVSVQATAPYCGDCLDAGAAGGGDAGNDHEGEGYDTKCDCYYIKGMH